MRVHDLQHLCPSMQRGCALIDHNSISCYIYIHSNISSKINFIPYFIINLILSLISISVVQGQNTFITKWIRKEGKSMSSSMPSYSSICRSPSFRRFARPKVNEADSFEDLTIDSQPSSSDETYKTLTIFH